ncbi:MAG: stage III sporulation protein AG [Oscillospiraceae bacterium]|nr:stage III sporulation protein AG [Oscillospiraceae bacterium]
MELVRKYRYVLIVALAGLGLMLLPSQTEESPPPAVQAEEAPDMETRLESILSRISGAGEVAVMLTEASGEEIFYQTDSDGTDTVLVTDAERNERGLVRTRQPPTYQGAVVVCSGADSATVRLAVVEAVSNVTGLGSDKITVLKMKQEE